MKWRQEQRLDKELQFHFDCQVADNLRAGMSEDEARRQATAEVRRHGRGQG